MARKKISELEAATDVTANDLIQVVDVEDGDMAPSGTNKKATASLLARELAKQPLEPGVVISGSSSSDAVRITQTGAGNALVVEDSTNPDSTPFVVMSNGNVGIGTSSPNAGTSLDVVGIIRSNQLVVQNTSGPANIEVGGQGDVYIDLKRPDSDDYDLRIATDSTISSIATASGQSLVFQQYGDNIGIGTASIESNCLLKLESTNKGFRPPAMTTTQRNNIATPIAGLMVYNSTTNKLNFYNGSAWEAVTSAV